MNAPVRHPVEDDVRQFPLPAAAFVSLVDSGALDTVSERVELIEGQLIRTPPPGPGHGDAESRCVKAFLKQLILLGIDSQYVVQTGGRLVLDTASVVGPDIMVLRPRESLRDWVPADLVLLVEVAHTSLSADLGAKARLYASAGVADYWVLDVEARVVIVHRDPRSGRYGSVETLEVPGQVSALLEPSLSFPVADLV
jgi:Uma2 family endonuclease